MPDIPADITGPKGLGCIDGVVDIHDLLLLFEYWGRCIDLPCLGPTGFCCEWADLDRNGWVDILDLFSMLTQWGVC